MALAFELGRLSVRTTTADGVRTTRKRTHSFLAICLAMHAGSVQGQQRASLSPVNDSHEISFQLREGYLIVVEGRIGNLSQLKCVIDTGATHSVVSQRIVQKLQLPRQPGHVFKFGRYALVEWAIFPEVQIGPINVRDAKMVVDGQPSDIPADIDAIIGLDLLARTSGFLIDYSASVISFRKASQSTALTCLTAQVMVQGHLVNLVADTGMHGFLLYDSVRQRFPHLKLKIEKTVRIGQLQAKQVKVSGVRLGSRESEALFFLIAQPSQAILADVDGYFGMDTLNARMIEFDFETRHLRWE